MLSKKSDAQQFPDSVSHDEETAFISRAGSAFLSTACANAEPAMVKHFINKKNDKGESLYPLKEAFIKIFSKPEEKYRQWFSRNRPYDESFEGFHRVCSQEGDLTFEDMKNRELCIRIILQHEKERIKKENPEFNEAQVNKKIADEYINVASQSPLFPLLQSGSASSLVKVIIDEIGIENIVFNIPYFYYPGSEYSRTPMQYYNYYQFKPLEVYLSEYLKMKYQDKDNESLYGEIWNFLNLQTSLFPDKMRVFPEHLKNAIDMARKELGPDVDEEKLRKVTNDFEAKMMPDAFEIQKSIQKSNRYLAIGLSFTIVAAPFVWLWYAYKVATAPIKIRETTPKAYSQYLKSQGVNSEEDLSTSESQQLKMSTERILENISKREPMRETKAKGTSVWNTPEVAVPKGDKIKVFTSRYNQQSSIFEKDIRKAERAVRQESARSPIL